MRAFIFRIVFVVVACFRDRIEVYCYWGVTKIMEFIAKEMVCFSKCLYSSVDVDFACFLLSI